MSDNIDAAAALEAANQKADTVAVPMAELARLRALDQVHTGLERDTAASFIERDLGSALKDASLIPGVSDQLLKLWKDDFVSRRVDGKWVVEAKTGGSVAEVVKARLSSGEYSHFIPASSRGGTGGSTGGNVPPPNTYAGGKPLTQLEKIAANIKAIKAAGYAVNPATMLMPK
jgi:hypothetical protein